MKKDIVKMASVIVGLAGALKAADTASDFAKQNAYPLFIVSAVAIAATMTFNLAKQNWQQRPK